MSTNASTTNRHVGLVFVALILTMLMSSLGQLIFSTALPTIVGDLGGTAHMSWVITAYLLGLTISLPIYGKLGDIWGRKHLLIAAILIFMAGSVIGAVSVTFTMLIVARVIQGLAAGGLMVLSQAITADVIPARQRGKYMGFMGAAFAMASVLGPVLGGWFTDGPGWRWGLWINLPLGALALTGTVVFLHLPRPVLPDARSRSIDYPGMIALAIATACLGLVATWAGHEYSYTHPLILGLEALCIVAVLALIAIEKIHPNPLIDLELFTHRNFLLASAVGLLIGVFLFGPFAYMPTYLQMVHSLSPTMAGLMLSPAMLSMTIMSIIVGLIVTRTGRYKGFMILGMVLAGVGLWLLSRLTVHSGLLPIAVALTVLGTGIGSTLQLLVLVVQNSFPLAVVGTATAMNNFLRQVGSSLGSAIVGGLFVARLSRRLSDTLPSALRALPGPEKAHWSTLFSQGHHATALLSPHLENSAPAPIRDAIIDAYNWGLIPVLGWLVPLAILAALLLIFLRADKLKETIG